MPFETSGFVGPKIERDPTPEDVRLENNDPLYYLFLKGKGVAAGVIDTADSQEAHDRLNELFAIDPEKVLSCAGKSPEEATMILDSIEEPTESLQKAA